jgi:hypothetical protein
MSRGLPVVGLDVEAMGRGFNQQVRHGLRMSADLVDLVIG